MFMIMLYISNVFRPLEYGEPTATGRMSLHYHHADINEDT